MRGKTQRDKILFWIFAIIIAIFSFVLCITSALYSFDKIFSDSIYQRVTPTDHRIKIIAIDEKTIAAYGDPSDWSREVPAQLIEKLNENEGMTPSVIALDVLYVSPGDTNGDQALIDACQKSGNVIAAVNTVYHEEVSRDLKVDKNHVEMVEYPYEGLKEVVSYGFANTKQDIDGYVRYTKNSVSYQGETIDSLAVATYKKYCEVMGEQPNEPRTFADDLSYFTYSGKSGAYEVVSMADVLSGKVDTRAFSNCIVLVGAYAPGLQDAYHVSVQKGTQMYGVEIHANIIEALMEQKTAVPVNAILFACFVMLVCLAYYFIGNKTKVLPATVLLVVLIGADIGWGMWLYQHGYVMGMIQLPLFLLVIYAYQLIGGYLTEVWKRRKVISAFKKYVAPQVVDEISKKGEFNLVLGGEKRHIAVLFVDIRGFTPMSEGLQPEQVVEILNEYLNLTTNAIFKNNGTLDKFVGDATMAVFNAPFDLDDYIYRAVCTARDIAAGSEELEKKLMERFGKSVSFGIGVNCGDAVVGNIGCEFRMDYTAIGDTVNTAARLESNAKRGQILISQEVYEALKGRIKVTEVGVIPLKGKSNDVFVYQLDEVM